MTKAAEQQCSNDCSAICDFSRNRCPAILAVSRIADCARLRAALRPCRSSLQRDTIGARGQESRRRKKAGSLFRISLPSALSTSSAFSFHRPALALRVWFDTAPRPCAVNSFEHRRFVIKKRSNARRAHRTVEQLKLDFARRVWNQDAIRANWARVGRATERERAGRGIAGPPLVESIRRRQNCVCIPGDRHRPTPARRFC